MGDAEFALDLNGLHGSDLDKLGLFRGIAPCKQTTRKRRHGRDDTEEVPGVIAEKVLGRWGMQRTRHAQTRRGAEPSTLSRSSEF